MLTGIHLQRIKVTINYSRERRYSDHTATIHNLLKLEGFYIRNIKKGRFYNWGFIRKRQGKWDFISVFTKNTINLTEHSHQVGLQIRIKLPKLYYQLIFHHFPSQGKLSSFIHFNLCSDLCSNLCSNVWSDAALIFDLILL